MGVFLESADEIFTHLDSLSVPKDNWLDEFEFQNVTDRFIELISN